MKHIRLPYIGFSFLLFFIASCHKKVQNNPEQEDLLKTTKNFNNQAKINSNNEEKLKELKSAYTQKIRSIDTIENWTGTLVLMDLDEVESYSSDTVMMRIGIRNTFDSGYQDFYEFLDLKAIPKNGTIFKKLKKLKKGSNVTFSGKPILVEHINGDLHGLEFNAFFIRTEISDVESN